MKYLKRGLNALLGGFLISICANSAIAHPSNIQASAPPGLADGPGVWLNIWNYPADSDAYCLKLHAAGIRNIFAQTSRSNTDAIYNPGGLGRLIDSAHRYKMRVIAWSFAELNDPQADADKLIVAAKFISPSGEKIDAIAANLEKDLSQSKIINYSERLKSNLGNNYPLIAVVYSPLNHAPVVATTPWPTLGKYYGVIAPMNYWNSKYEHIVPFEYTLQTIKKVRQLVGKPDIEIHVIGDGMGTHSDSIKQFMAACRLGGATSASLYPNQKITDEQLACLAQYPEYFPINSRFRLASYHELIQHGTLVTAANTDPADPIKRGEFYGVLLRQFYPTYASSLNYPLPVFSSAEAFDALNKIGVFRHTSSLPVNDPSFLSQTISPKEALDTLAAVIAIPDKQPAHQGKATKPHPIASNVPHKTEHLFAQPAFAESSKPSTLEPSSLSYLDAAQIVVQASAALKP